MTPAEELRATAAKLRETAAPIVTYATGHPITGTWYGPGHLADALKIHVGTPNATADEDWIALMCPALAEPLAKWLDSVADGIADHDPDNGCECTAEDSYHRAIEVARVINGTAK